AAFFWPRTADAPPPPTTATLRALAAGLPVPTVTVATVDALATRHGFLHWDHVFPDVRAAGGFDVVLGNPPFLNQLERDTVASRPAAALQRARFGDTVGAYTDTAALLLLQGARLLRPGGRLGMVQPQSTLAAKDARGVRAALATLAPPTHVWWAGAHVFAGISVYVAALVLRRAPPATVHRAHGPDFAPLPDLPADTVLPESWTPLVADALGAPAVHLRGPGRLADLCRATADFRDEYYGLVPFVLDRRDADEDRFPRLVLTGHVDPARSWWGDRPVRFGRKAWEAPRVDLAALEAEGSLAAWAAARRVPKLLLATQTRVLEAVADPDGRWLTTTPTVTVLPAPDALWRVAAVLLGPPASAWALAHYGAAALAAGAIKLAARQVEAIPTPSDDAAWHDAATRVAAAHAATDPAAARAHLEAAAALTVRAYGADPALVTWWRGRLPSIEAR
ncbi:MAG: Eco57I restriction-modification methylase domain-containing protein, partial [Myxococcota bacterium]